MVTFGLNRTNSGEQSVGRGAADRVVSEVNVDWRRPGQRNRYTITMPTKLHGFRILGMYPVEPTDLLLQETLEIQWGSDLSGAELHRAQAAVAEHFAELYLIEVQIDPPDADVEWASITQPVEHQPQSNWQVPYDEHLVDSVAGRWAFFMHFVDPGQPLQTPIGPVQLPPPSPRPPTLSWIDYEAP